MTAWICSRRSRRRRRGNVLRLCEANLGKLVAERAWKEMTPQLALSGEAVRFLQSAPIPDAPADLPAQLAGLLAAMEKLDARSRGGDAGAIRAAFEDYQGRLTALAAGFDAKVTKAEVFSCPMCKGIRELDPAARCPKCGMKLTARIIPATGIPGEPSIVLTPVLSAPLEAGKESEVRLRMTWKRDGSPVAPEDLLVVHTERIHLLIIDSSLDDYHHEHPRPTGDPGEVVFKMTPKRPGDYRVFADVTPVLSHAQEYVRCDLPGTGAGGAVVNRIGTLQSTAAGLDHQLRWLTGGGPVLARRPVTAVVTINGRDGKPFRRLEPVMAAFAHIVGFYEDRKTVVHIHPNDAEPKGPDDRGGPSFMFRLYAPRSGYIRLFCQTQVDGNQVFAPFGLNVEDKPIDLGRKR